MAGWRDAAIHVAKQKTLKTFGDDKYFVVPKKWPLDTMRQVQSLYLEYEKNKGELAITEEMVDLVKLGVLHGVGAHNFDDENGQVLEWNAKLVADIMETSSDTAMEIFGIAGEYNAPLESETSGISETSQNGSTDKSNSSQENDSQMEVTPES